MERSRLITYLAAAACGLASAALYWAKQTEAATSLAALSLYLAGYAKQHMADKPRPDERPKDGGHADGSAMAILIALVVLFGSFFLSVRTARADERWKYGLSTAVASAIDLKTGDFTTLIPLGGCFDVTHSSSGFGIGACFAPIIGTGSPNKYLGSLLGHWKGVGVGVACRALQVDGRLVPHAMLLFEGRMELVQF